MEFCPSGSVASRCITCIRPELVCGVCSIYDARIQTILADLVSFDLDKFENECMTGMLTSMIQSPCLTSSPS